jgi:hypothetical protein
MTNSIVSTLPPADPALYVTVLSAESKKLSFDHLASNIPREINVEVIAAGGTVEKHEPEALAWLK